MAFINLVQQRQSTRAYRATPVPRALIERCLEAARLAPSACNCQPWRFIVVDDLDTRSALATAAFSGVYSMCAFAKHAPVLIAVITERSSYAAALGGMFRGTQYNLIDIGIACEHLVLQATEEGLGTCWLGWFNEKSAWATPTTSTSAPKRANPSTTSAATPASANNGIHNLQFTIYDLRLGRVKRHVWLIAFDIFCRLHPLSAIRYPLSPHQPRPLRFRHAAQRSALHHWQKWQSAQRCLRRRAQAGRLTRP